MKLAAALIVRNEEAVLQRCLDSLAPHIDAIAINDNGSIDGTLDLIEQFHQTDVILATDAWQDFAHNRNLVLSIARKAAPYVLCGIDADEELVVPEGYEWPKLTADAYNIEVHLDNLVYPRTAIVRSATPWYWKYPVQEGLYCDKPTRVDNIPDVYIRSHRGQGARAKDPDTQKKDLELLERCVAENPDDTRMVFYLAQQYKDMGQLVDAERTYKLRLGMPGFEAERWYSMFMCGRIREWIGSNPASLYLDAFDMDPSRAEPLYYLADWYRRDGRLASAFLYANTGALLRPPESGLFVEADVYEWRLLDIMATTAWYTPFRDVGQAASELLATRKVSDADAQRIAANHGFYTRM